MKTLALIFLLVFVSYNTKAQYITEIIDYQPAPGQHINSTGGTPAAAQTLIGGVNGFVTLGSFGGYVVFRFENPVVNDENNPYGVDFTIFGNPQFDWSEPGVVLVMKDENLNGLADDTWYELAGSDYFFSSTRHNYQATYTNPKTAAAHDVAWTDNDGNTGTILANDYHIQPYYPSNELFASVSETAYTLAGTKLADLVNAENPGVVKFYKRAFGYADNQLRGTAPYTTPDNPYTAVKENSGGDAFDISWAVDANGNYIDLNEIHFVKVQSAVLANAGWLGEISTDITGAVDVTPNANLSGEEYTLVVKDLPREISTQTLQLEAFVFHKGRLLTDVPIAWKINTLTASVDENNVLSVSENIGLEVTAALVDMPEIKAKVSALVRLTPTDISENADVEASVYPNPANNYLQLSLPEAARISVFTALGKQIYAQNNTQSHETIDVSHWCNGIYVLKIETNTTATFRRIMIQR